MKSHDHLKKWLCEVRPKIEHIKSHLSQYLLPPKLGDRWLTATNSYPIPWSCYFRPSLGLAFDMICSFRTPILKSSLTSRWYMNLFQSSTIFQQRNNHEIFWGLNFCKKLFQTPNWKSTLATLYVATIEKPELTFRLISYFRDLRNS